jgi:hypothetical protein
LIKRLIFLLAASSELIKASSNTNLFNDPSPSDISEIILSIFSDDSDKLLITIDKSEKLPESPANSLDV